MEGWDELAGCVWEREWCGVDASGCDEISVSLDSAAVVVVGGTSSSISFASLRRSYRPPASNSHAFWLIHIIHTHPPLPGCVATSHLAASLHSLF